MKIQIPSSKTWCNLTNTVYLTSFQLMTKKNQNKMTHCTQKCTTSLEHYRTKVKIPKFHLHTAAYCTNLTALPSVEGFSTFLTGTVKDCVQKSQHPRRKNTAPALSSVSWIKASGSWHKYKSGWEQVLAGRREHWKAKIRQGSLIYTGEKQKQNRKPATALAQLLLSAFGLETKFVHPSRALPVQNQR